VRRMPATRTFACAMLAASALLSACAQNEEEVSLPRAGLSCVDDSAHCIGQRQSALKHLVAQQDKSWMKQPATADAYASGVRLFAFKKTKRTLSCDELSHAKKEADAGPQVLRGPQGKNLSPAQVSRGAMLAGEVSRELGSEFNKRCKKA
jgi:hypothetical protein